MLGWVLLTVAASYVVAEWSVRYKSGGHDVRDAARAVLLTPAPMEPERPALQAQMDRLAETFGQYRAAKEREIADLQRLIANLERQIQVLTAQRTPEQQVAALRAAASRPVRWATVEQDGASEGTRQGAHTRLTQQARDAAPPSLLQLAREAGFTRVEVRQ
jgi:hypothetical protein